MKKRNLLKSIINFTNTKPVAVLVIAGLIIITGTLIVKAALTISSSSVTSDSSLFFYTSSTVSAIVIDINGNVGIGTTTPRSILNIAGSKPQLTLSDTSAGPNLKHWFLSSQGGNFYIGTSSDDLATTSIHLAITPYNTFLGMDAGRFNQLDINGWKGVENTFIGNGAGFSNTTGYENIALGSEALYLNTEGFGDTAIGPWALNANTTGADNIAIGDSSLFSNTIGEDNTAVGVSTLFSNTSGAANIAIGLYALSTTNGSYSSAMGNSALFNNASATSTTAIGYESAKGTASYSNQYGVYLGYQAGYSAQTGSNNNTMIGYKAGWLDTTGANNITLGYQAGDNLTAGSNNIIIGYDIDVSSTTGNYQLDIGNLIFGTGLNGTTTTLSTGNIGIGTSAPSSTLHLVNGTATTSLSIGSAQSGANSRGRTCFWNGTNYTIMSFSSNSVTPLYSTSTVCN